MPGLGGTPSGTSAIKTSLLRASARQVSDHFVQKRDERGVPRKITPPVVEIRGDHERVAFAGGQSSSAGSPVVKRAMVRQPFPLHLRDAAKRHKPERRRVRPERSKHRMPHVGRRTIARSVDARRGS